MKATVVLDLQQTRLRHERHWRYYAASWFPMEKCPHKQCKAWR